MSGYVNILRCILANEIPDCDTGRDVQKASAVQSVGNFYSFFLDSKTVSLQYLAVEKT